MVPAAVWQTSTSYFAARNSARYWTIYAGSLTAPSPYSIGKNPGEYGYSVVKAFAKYGWGWGGNGYSGGKKHDFMHFSVLASGG